MALREYADTPELLVAWGFGSEAGLRWPRVQGAQDAPAGRTRVADDWASTLNQVSAEHVQQVRASLLENAFGLYYRMACAALEQAVSGIEVSIIDTMAPEPLDLIKPFHVTVVPYEDEYRAAFLDANLSAFGETAAEALWNLKDIIAATFEKLDTMGEQKLGAGVRRQLTVLRKFLRRAG